MIRMVSPR